MTEDNNKILYQSIKEEFQNLFSLTMNYPKGGQKNPCSFTQVADMVVVHIDTTPEDHFLDSGFNAIKDFKKLLSDVGLPKTAVKEEYSYIPVSNHHPSSITTTISSEMPKTSLHGRGIKVVKSDMTLILSFSPEGLSIIARAHRLALYKKAHARLTVAHKEVEEIAAALPQEEQAPFMKEVLNVQGWGKLRDLEGINSRASTPAPQLG